ncbi:hypothetical protein OF83DRAFT_1085952 [Amylostereum chailletii]|nr:hypothetical protein OF83DRAFT_1085952 [Amylostereum chailletii]
MGDPSKMVAEELSAAFRELLPLEGDVFYCLGYHKAGFCPVEPMNKRAWVCNPTEVEAAKVALQQEKCNEINTARRAKYAATQVAAQGAKAGTGDGIPGSLVPAGGDRHWPGKSPSEVGPHFLERLKYAQALTGNDANLIRAYRALLGMAHSSDASKLEETEGCIIISLPERVESSNLGADVIWMRDGGQEDSQRLLPASGLSMLVLPLQGEDTMQGPGPSKLGNRPGPIT